MIRILVVDDHAVVRRGIVQILAETPDMRCTCEATTGREALLVARDRDLDLVVLDIQLPDDNGLDILKRLRAINPALPVLILSMYPEHQYASRAFNAGATGYLTKDSVPDELILAIRSVAQGGRYISQTLADTFISRAASPYQDEPHLALSDREDQVLRLLATGQTVTQISEMLSLGVKTVSTYRSRILSKLGLTTTAELMRYALDHGLVD